MTVYADLGGTKTLPVYENTDALLYVQPREETDIPVPREILLLQGAVRKCEAAGIPVRLSFYDNHLLMYHSKFNPDGYMNLFGELP